MGKPHSRNSAQRTLPHTLAKKLRFELGLGDSFELIALRYGISKRLLLALELIKGADPWNAPDPIETIACAACHLPITPESGFTVLEGLYWHLKCISGF
jgi:hypothetical protein